MFGFTIGIAVVAIVLYRMSRTIALFRIEQPSAVSSCPQAHDDTSVDRRSQYSFAAPALLAAGRCSG